MSGVSFGELIILCMIGLIVLGPKRLPQVARQLGSWVGQARSMTRQLKTQLEEELDIEKNLGIDPSKMHIPFDDDSYSPAHNDDASADKDTAGEDAGNTDSGEKNA